MGASCVGSGTVVAQRSAMYRCHRELQLDRGLRIRCGLGTLRCAEDLGSDPAALRLSFGHASHASWRRASDTVTQSYLHAPTTDRSFASSHTRIDVAGWVWTGPGARWPSGRPRS